MTKEMAVKKIGEILKDFNRKDRADIIKTVGIDYYITVSEFLYGSSASWDDNG